MSSNNRPEGEVTVHMGNADRAQWPLPQRGRFGSSITPNLCVRVEKHEHFFIFICNKSTGCGWVQVCNHIKRARTGAERRHRTFEPRPTLENKKERCFMHHSFLFISARRGSNPRPPPWQGGAPPLSHSRILYRSKPVS